MHIFTRTAVLTACLLAPSIAIADDSGWHLGASLGLSQASEPAPLFSQTAAYGEPAFTHFESSSGDRDSTAVQLEGGYWSATTNMGVQFGYLNLGQYTHFVRGFTYLDCQLCGGFGFVDSSKVKVSGTTLALAGRWPLSASTELIGKAGIFLNQVTYYDVTNFGSPVALTYPHKSIDVAPTVALSFGWNFASHWEALLELDKYFAVGDSKYGMFNVTALSFGFQYHF